MPYPKRLAHAVLAMALLIGTYCLPCAASNYVSEDGVWWQALSPHDKYIAIAAGINAFEGAFGMGITEVDTRQILACGNGGEAVLKQRVNDPIITLRTNKFTSDAKDCLAQMLSSGKERHIAFSKPFQYYIGQIDAFYSRLKDPSSIQFFTPLSCLTDEPWAWGITQSQQECLDGFQ